MPSYGTDEDFAIYLTSTGRTLPVGIVPAVVRADGTLWVDQFERRYRSVALTDENSFPREAWPVVPQRVEWASYEAAWAVATGVYIWGDGGTAGGQVIEERVDVLSVKYAGPQDGLSYWESLQFIIPRAYALLTPFFKRGGTYASAFVV